MPSAPFAHAPELAEIVKVAAAPLLPAARRQFYEAVDRHLRSEPELGPGAVARACARAQREFVAAIDVSKVIDGRP